MIAAELMLSLRITSKTAKSRQKGSTLTCVSSKECNKIDHVIPSSIS